MSPEMGPTAEQEDGESPLERELAEFEEALRAEKRELLAELEHYQVRDFDFIGDPEAVDDMQLGEITKEWLEGTRQETGMLRPLDRLGIEIFKEDLADQPGFPGTLIEFGSKSVLQTIAATGQSIMGESWRSLSLVSVGVSKPSLRTQLGEFLLTGSLTQGAATLSHELVHRYHFDRNLGTDSALTEAQAYFNGLWAARDDFSLREIADRLAVSETRGLYKVDVSKAVESMVALAELYGLGYEEERIGDLIAGSHFDPETGRFEPLMSELEKAKTERGVTGDVDSMTLYDIYRLHVSTQRLRSRLLLFKTIESRYSKEERRQFKIDQVKRGFGFPTYRMNGREVPAQEYLQMLSCPVNEKYPYDPDGRRSGVVFGMFPGEGDQAVEPSFGLGRWEAVGTDGHVDLAKTEEEKQRYLDDLSEATAAMSSENRIEPILAYICRGEVLGEQHGFTAVARTLIRTDEDRRVLGRNVVSMAKAPIEAMAKATVELMADRPAWEGSRDRIQAFHSQVVILSAVKETLDLPFKETDEEFAATLDGLDRDLRTMMGELDPVGEIVTPEAGG